MQILLIDSDPAVTATIELLMQREGYTLVTADLADDGISIAKTSQPDLIMLGYDLADMRGIDAMRALRHARVRTPVMMLSLHADVTCKVNALNAGADDYVMRPFAAPELFARIQAIVRRSKGFSQNALRIGRLTLNLDSQTVEADGIRIHVTQREWQILKLLAMRRGTCITKDMVLDCVYGGMDEPEIKIVDVFVCKIRKKFSAAIGDPIIETVWGRGYMIRDLPPVDPVEMPQLLAA